MKRALLILLVLSGATGVAQAQEALVAVADTFAFPPDLTFDSGAVTLMANDSGADGDSLAALLLATPSHGTLTIRPDGSFAYEPEAGYQGYDTFTYSLRSLPLQTLTVSADESTVNFEATVGTPVGSDSDDADIRINGTATAEIWPTASPLDSIRVRTLNLANTDAIGLRFNYGSPVSIGSLRVNAEAGAIKLALSQPGASSEVVPGFNLFTQSDNKLGVAATVMMEGTGLLSSFVPTDPQNLVTETDWNVIGNAQVIGDQLSVRLPVIFEESVDIDGNPVDLKIVGTAVASGTLRAVRESSGIEVLLVVGDPNKAPETTRSVAALAIRSGSPPVQVDLGGLFADPDQDELTLSAASSDTTVAAVAVNGLFLDVTVRSAGSALVTVRAEDAGGKSAEASFTVDVLPNASPVAAVSPSDMALIVDVSTGFVLLAQVFSDSDGDPLAYTASSSDESVATVLESGGGLTVTPIAAGSAVVAVLAEDGFGGSATVGFAVSVRTNVAPTVDHVLADREIRVGGGIQSIDVSTVFSDADGDALVVTATSSDEGAVAVVLADGVLTLEPVDAGSSVIVLSASDNIADPVESQFTVTALANAPPSAVTGIQDVEMLVGGATISMDVSGAFADGDDDTIHLVAASSDSMIVSVTLSEGILQLEARSVGSAIVTLSASDDFGGAGELTFTAFVPSGVDTEVGGDLPRETQLLPNYPNPFQGSTAVRFSLAEPGFVQLRVFDLLGRVVASLRTGEYAPGSHSVRWDAAAQPAGVYVIRLEVDGGQWTRTVVVR